LYLLFGAHIVERELMKKFSRRSNAFYLHELFHSPFLDFIVNTQNNPISHMEQNSLNPIPRGTNTALASTIQANFL
jgi:hypothetical protein